MYICNTGLDCEDCVGGCEAALEWEDDFDFIEQLLQKPQKRDKNNERIHP